MGASHKQLVTVAGQTYEIWVTQRSKASWSAHGDFNGKHIQVTDRSEGAAISKWQMYADQEDKS